MGLTPLACARCGAELAAGARYCGGCGEAVPAGEPTVGGRPAERQIGRFVLGPPIGHGGMGVVHRARDTDLNREIALKLISPALAGDHDFRARFEAEARAAAAVDHPNVLPVFEAGEDDGELYLAMRLVEGTDLRALLAQTSPLPPVRAARIVAQIAAALDAAHSRNLVHRDVKPANVLIDASGGEEHVYLTDFGLTQTIGGDGDITSPGQVVGTANYLAPEQIAYRPIDGRVDVYALSCLAFELLTGAPPFARETVAATMEAHLREPIPAASARVAGLPREVDEVLAGGLAKRPEERFASCGAMAKAMGTALGTDTGAIPRDPQVAARARPRQAPPQPRPAEARTAPTAIRPRPTERRTGGRALAAVLALLVGAALVAILLPSALRESGGEGADLDAALPVLSGAQAVNGNLSGLLSDLALDPLDEEVRADQAERLPTLQGTVAGLLARTRATVDPPIRPLLTRSLRAQAQLLDRYARVLRTPPAAAQPLIAGMQATIEGVETDLRAPARR